MFVVSLIKQLLISFHCHDCNAFRFLVLQRFNVNNFGFHWAILATIFLFFQRFTFWSSTISFGQANFTVQSNKDLAGHATRVD